MNSLGIYFGPKIISFVDCKAGKISVSSSIPWAKLNSSELQDKVPIDLKLVAALKEEFRNQKLLSKDAVLCLSSNDMIIRTFEIPILPPSEMQNALKFEIKKYLPFKLEELVADFQIQGDKASRRYSVLFLGIKKDTLDRYVSIFTQLGIKISSIEYSAFSLLRLMSLTKVSQQGVVAVINVDTEQQEAEFTVMKNGFPLFSREIQLLAGSGDAFQIPESNEMAAEKIKTEVRISLDYYNRKFPLQGIRQIQCIGGLEFQDNLSAFVKDFGLPIQFVNTAKLLEKGTAFSLGMLKAYSSALAGSTKTTVKINLLSVWQTQRKKAAGKQGVGSDLQEAVTSLLTDFQLDMRMVVLAVILWAGVFGYGIYTKVPLQNAVNRIIASRTSSLLINTPNITPEELKLKYTAQKENYDQVVDLLGKQMFFTSFLSAFRAITPEGVWLTRLTIHSEKGSSSCMLEGYATKPDSAQEAEAVYAFLVALKKQPVFAKRFKDFSLDAIDAAIIESKKVSHFQITCKEQKGK